MGKKINQKEIINNNDYSLEISIKRNTFTLNLMIKISKIRIDVYQMILKQLKDVDGLDKKFQTMQELEQYMKENINLVDVDLDTKIIRILTTIQNTKKNKIVQIASIPLQFLNTINNSKQQKQNEQNKIDISKQEKQISGMKSQVCNIKGLKQKKQKIKETESIKEEILIEKSEKKEKMKNVVDIKQWVDPSCPDFKDLLLDGNIITAKQYALVFGRNKIVGEYIFTATFSNIGISDTRNKNRKSWNNNCVFYTNDGSCRVGNVSNQNGKGFQAGENVTVIINLKQGSIQWLVGSEIRHQETVEILKNNNITWVPYIYLHKEDSVEINEE